MSEDIELNWSHLNNLVRNAFEHFIPTITVRDNNEPFGFNPDIQHHINVFELSDVSTIIILLNIALPTSSGLNSNFNSK